MKGQAGSQALGRLEALLAYLARDVDGSLAMLRTRGNEAAAVLRLSFPLASVGTERVLLVDGDQAMLDLYLLEMCLSDAGAGEDAHDAHHQLEVILSVLARTWNRAPWEATRAGLVGCAGEEVRA